MSSTTQVQGRQETVQNTSALAAEAQTNLTNTSLDLLYYAFIPMLTLSLRVHPEVAALFGR